MRWLDRLRSAAAGLDVSIAEFIVLDELRMNVPLDPTHLATFCVKEVQHLDELTFRAEDYAGAISSCIRKGWLVLLTDADVEASELHSSRTGSLGLTQAGTKMITQILANYQCLASD